MYKTHAIITNVDNFKEHHLLISIYSTKFGKKKLIVFGGKSRKKNSSYIKGIVNEIEFNKDDSCLSSSLIQSYNWFIFDKYQLKTIDYVCYLINKILFLHDEKSEVINNYTNLISRMNKRQNYLSELMILELEILRSSGYQPILNEKVLKKIFNKSKMHETKSYQKLIIDLSDDLDSKLLFFNFLGKVISRVLINLHINLPFPRDEIIKKS